MSCITVYLTTEYRYIVCYTVHSYSGNLCYPMWHLGCDSCEYRIPYRYIFLLLRRQRCRVRTRHLLQWIGTAHKDRQSHFVHTKNNNNNCFICCDSLSSRNWSALEKLKAVLPEDQEGVSGFSIVGNSLVLLFLLMTNLYLLVGT